jgi:hypothetical protein
MSKNVTKPAKVIVLTRAQIGKLCEITKHFKDIDKFEIHVDHSSGIGTGICVKFDQFKKSDTTVDITDVTNW